MYGLCRFRIGLMKRFKNGSPRCGYTCRPDIFLTINKAGRIAPSEFSLKVISGVAKEAASKCGLRGAAPHGLRRTYVRLCHQAVVELDLLLAYQVWLQRLTDLPAMPERVYY